MVRLVSDEVVAVRRPGRTDTGRDQGHIEDGLRAEILQEFEGERPLHLKDTDRRPHHILPDLLVIPVNLAGLRIRDTSQLAGVIDDANVVQHQKVELHKGNLVDLVHVDIEDQVAILPEAAVVILQSDRTDHDAGGVHPLRCFRTEDAVVVIEDIRVRHFGLLGIGGELLLDGLANLDIVGIVWLDLFLLPGFREALLFPAMPETHTDKLDGRLIRRRAPGRDSGGVGSAEPVDKVLEDSGAVSVDDIDVDVAHLFPVLIGEAGKDRVPFFGVQVDDVRDIGDTGTADGTSGRTNGNTILPTPTDELRHTEDVTGHIDLLEDPQLLRQARLEPSDLALRNDTPFHLIVELGPGGFHQLLPVGLAVAVELRVLQGKIQLEVLNHIGKDIGILDGLHPHGLRNGVLLAKGIHQLVVALIGQVEGILVTVGLLLGIHQNASALRFVRAQTVGICPSDERFLILLGENGELLVEENLVPVEVRLDFQKVIALDQLLIPRIFDIQLVQRRGKTGAGGDNVR